MQHLSVGAQVRLLRGVRDGTWIPSRIPSKRHTSTSGLALLQRLLSRADRQDLSRSVIVTHADPPSLRWALRRELGGGGGDDEDDEEERDALREILRSQHQLAQRLSAQHQLAQRERTDQLEQQVAALQRQGSCGGDVAGEVSEVSEEMARQRERIEQLHEMERQRERQLAELRALEEDKGRQISEIAAELRERRAAPTLPAGDVPMQEIIERSAALAAEAATKTASEAAQQAAAQATQQGLASISGQLAQVTDAAGAAAQAAQEGAQAAQAAGQVTQQAADMATQVSGEAVRKVQCEKLMCEQQIHNRRELKKKFPTLHPDMGGNPDMWHRIQACYDKINDANSVYCPKSAATARASSVLSSAAHFVGQNKSTLLRAAHGDPSYPTKMLRMATDSPGTEALPEVAEVAAEVAAEVDQGVLTA